MSSLFSAQDNDDIDFTRKTRMKLVRSLVKDETVPEDTASQNILLSALDSIDRAVFTKAKLTTQDKLAEAAQAEADAMGDFMIKLAEENQARARRERVPVLSDQASVLDVVPGEMTMGAVPVPVTEIIPPKI